MKSRWTDKGARQAVLSWGPEHGDELALRVYTARLIGHESDLVLHGGGNASMKGARRSVFGDEYDTLSEGAWE